ncbi:hypothetical protein [Micromonospora sp. RTGN7]|uniref:hypothetical protein n=1 Tax=Micromonospora sp. RTGN7 TaxID=3016526 RepID=UPI0029FF547C|nr:hypothetical protein [Micromonospora sp. RTGN7]
MSERLTDAELRAAAAAASEPFVFRPLRSARPWWRPRWLWTVISATGQVARGHTWTEAGAYRRAGQQAQRTRGAV